MNKYHLLSLVCFISGIVLFALGILSGEVETGFIVVFPFIKGSGIFAFLGIIFIFVAMVLFMFSFTRHIEKTSFEQNKDENYPVEKKTTIKGGGIILIGPIPVVFGSNWKIAIGLMVVAIILIIVAIFAFKIV